VTLLSRFAAAWKAIMQGDKGLTTPDVTRTQQFALGQAVVVVLIVLGFDLDSDTEQLLIGLSATLAAALPVSDAAVRRGRSANAEKVAAAQTKLAQADGAAADAPTALSDAERQKVLDRLLQLAD
jgi:hypothetical protein